MTKNRRDLLIVGGLWIAASAVGMWATATFSLLPTLASEQGEEVDSAFVTLFYYAWPVFMLVIVVLVYSVLRWRVREPEEGETFADSNVFSWTWFGASVVLASVIFVNPGMTGFLALRDQPEPEIVIELTGVQWHWDVGFPNMDMTMEAPSELLLPKDKVIRFDLTSVDVIHSFWVPAFRMKQDAIPGQVNSVTITPTELGSFETDPNFRLQCAELCGIGHARMFLPVRVVEPEEFEAWLAGMGGMGDAEMDMEDADMEDGEMEDGDMEDGEMEDGEMEDGEMDMSTTTLAEG